MISFQLMVGEPSDPYRVEHPPSLLAGLFPGSGTQSAALRAPGAGSDNQQGTGDNRAAAGAPARLGADAALRGKGAASGRASGREVARRLWACVEKKSADPGPASVEASARRQRAPSHTVGLMPRRSPELRSPAQRLRDDRRDGPC